MRDKLSNETLFPSLRATHVKFEEWRGDYNHAAGVEFIAENGGGPGVRLRGDGAHRRAKLEPAVSAVALFLVRTNLGRFATASTMAGVGRKPTVSS